MSTTTFMDCWFRSHYLHASAQQLIYRPDDWAIEWNLEAFKPYPFLFMILGEFVIKQTFYVNIVINWNLYHVYSKIWRRDESLFFVYCARSKWLSETFIYLCSSFTFRMCSYYSRHLVTLNGLFVFLMIVPWCESNNTSSLLGIGRLPITLDCYEPSGFFAKEPSGEVGVSSAMSS